MRISVVFKNGEKGSIEPKDLENLVDFGLIDRFKRSDGWVQVGRDPLRGVRGMFFQGKERREGDYHQ
ncbi:MAG: hypothetical protein C0617_11180 [Desulfuromonas sp.]|uniref:GSU3473 family protein n=1 Tax=Desulfuromonas sp. TaxID=892 RepID=UPI000CAEC2C0|nr:hypothetical protein [Desulfuromonas sp.]PLX83485.1 MAG: hypothetical protein C0617_11180 [Desulfuromonas sp.]